MCACVSLTKVCLKGLWLDYLTTVAAHHQVEVVLCGTLAKYGHVCKRKIEADGAQLKENK